MRSGQLRSNRTRCAAFLPVIPLYQLGCEYAQGFAFGEPMYADAAMRLLTEERLEAAS